MANVNEIARAFKALSDETRLSILRLLMDGEYSVGEVTNKLGISQTSASRNLNTLNEAGFLKLKRDGRWSRYSIANETERTYIGKLIELMGDALAVTEIARKTERSPAKGEENLGW